MRYRRAVLVILFFCGHWLLSACGPMTIKDEAKQSYISIEGWTLELHQEVVIPPRRTRVFFQDGRLLYGINELRPHCQLRVRRISDQPQVVRADRFSIDTVFGARDQIVLNERMLMASADITVIVADGGNGGGNGEGKQIYLYFMGLRAEKQPNVTYLVCGGALEDPPLAEYPTIQEIRTSLGDYATLILPPPL